jgi:hypothetical protein
MARAKAGAMDFLGRARGLYVWQERMPCFSKYCW